MSSKNTCLPPELVAGEGENPQTTVAVGSILLMKLQEDGLGPVGIDLTKHLSQIDVPKSSSTTVCSISLWT